MPVPKGKAGWVTTERDGERAHVAALGRVVTQRVCEKTRQQQQKA